MTEYDPDALDAQAEEAEELKGETFKAAIVGVEGQTAGDYYGEDTPYDPDRELVVVTAEAVLEDNPNEKFTHAYGAPKGPSSWHQSDFHLGQFRDYYGSVPKEGMEVEARYGDNGFLEIHVPD